ncbi:hypothetical protein ONS95_006904 [Cadophora gregata]|uniref:uncharacterized protein n=1 Tax=Cadophora gregata TaxID=51156 RepID=UPI0026DABBED|nr:uncharacterized protein ONS95_006904 [Cadophora gregata]KAK0101752.1 hypothetical protein ONS95_006904 [Cadophora gregata]KAK0106232.1 hypothetical protein ONS96_014940 [Cadophora gregata f. sp. sojae]
MNAVDYTNVFLIITVSEVHPAATLSHNASFRIGNNEISDEEGSTHGREGTPFTRVPRTWLVLTLSRKPFDPLLGWVFGSDKKSCDILLDTSSRNGVSRRHFSINHDRDSRSVILTNISQHGTRLTSESIGFEGMRITGNESWRIRPDERTTVDTGKTYVSIEVPRDAVRGKWRSEYEANLEACYREAQEAVPRIDKLKFHGGPIEDTPAEAYASRYVLQEKLGSGTFGTVYKAFDRYSKQVYAAKTVSSSYSPQEVEILQKTSHDHIVAFIDAFNSPESTIVMEYMAGGNFSQLLSPTPNEVSITLYQQC